MFFTQLFQLVKYYVFLMELTQAVLQKGATRDTPPLKSYARDILKLNGRRCRIMVQNGKLYLTSH